MAKFTGLRDAWKFLDTEGVCAGRPGLPAGSQLRQHDGGCWETFVSSGHTAVACRGPGRAAAGQWWDVAAAWHAQPLRAQRMGCSSVRLLNVFEVTKV